MKYHQLTAHERYQIEAGISLGLSIHEVARRLGRHRSTIFRELKRNAHISREGYSAIYSQTQYEDRRKRHCRRKYIIRGSLKRWIDIRLKAQWSPEQIVGRRSLEYDSSLGVETIYRYLYREKIKGNTLWLNLRHARLRRKPRFKHHRWPGHLNRKGLQHRPMIVEKRRRFGDFERDLIVGKDRQGYLLTVVDRKTKLTRIEKIDHPRSELVHEATVKTLKGLKVRSITNDNGFEFTGFKKTSKELKAPIYFCRPYASWERGTVENTNKLIRQYFPKKTNLKELSDEKIKMVEMALNYRPRKQLGFRTPIEASA
jgi:transposase, IS30 family